MNHTQAAMPAGGAMTARGYYLIEVMIALALLAVVIGGALMPLQARLEQEGHSAAVRQLREAKNAVHAFALLNGTSNRRVLYHDRIQYPLPARRPYLPCPDISGDGLEDRHPMPAPLPAIFDVAITMHALSGACLEQKGMLPWLTLGVQESDPWGNHLTYRVDKKYSSQLFGFDETLSADMFDYAKPLSVGFYQLYDSRDDSGAIVCDDFFDDLAAGGCPNIGLTNVKAGVLATASVKLGARNISAYGDVAAAEPQGQIDGPVFVIVSHGQDGHGAITSDNKCRPPPRKTNNMIESANAYYRPDHPFRLTTGIFNCPPPPATIVPLRENLFVTSPISDVVNDEVDAPDDYVTWTNRQQLYGFLAQNGALPIGKLEYLIQ